jgi:hypothetical protein
MQSCWVADGPAWVSFDWVRAAPQLTSLRQIGIDTITSRLWNEIHRRHIWQRDSNVAHKPEELEESKHGRESLKRSQEERSEVWLREI